MKVKLEGIRIDGGTQPRCEIDESLVAEYAEDMQDGDKFPPVVVFQDGANYWLADGFHRYFASKKVGYIEIEAETKQGTKRDAILYSVSANGKHGKRRTNKDKRKAVKTLLEDEEWSQWSDREIARQAEVSNGFVSKLRRESTVNNTQSKRKGSDGRTIDTSNIGKSNFDEAKESTLDNHKKTFEKLSEDDGGYDIPDNVDPETGEVVESPKPTDNDIRKELKRRKKLRQESAVGLEVAENVLSQLTKIPADDPERVEALDLIADWITNNR